MSSIKELLEFWHLLYVYIYILNASSLFFGIDVLMHLRDGIEKEESFDCQERVDGGLQYFGSIIITDWC